MRFYGRDALLLFIRETRHGFSQLTAVMGNVRVAHYLASFHKNAVFVKTRYCFICPPSLAVAARTPIFEPPRG